MAYEDKMSDGLVAEMTDRLYVVITMIDTILLDHIYTEMRPEHHKEILKAQQILIDLYQAVGSEL